MLIRNRFGAWCGYAGVTRTHPWYGLGMDDVDVDVHGGLSYASVCDGHICHVPKSGEPEDVWWFGFDCLHAFDLAPGLVRLMPENDLGDEMYRDMEFAREETVRLAGQLAAATSQGG